MDSSQIKIMNCIFYFPIHLSRWSTDNQPCDRFNDTVWNARKCILHVPYMFVPTMFMEGRFIMGNKILYSMKREFNCALSKILQ